MAYLLKRRWTDWRNGKTNGLTNERTNGIAPNDPVMEQNTLNGSGQTNVLKPENTITQEPTVNVNINSPKPPEKSSNSSKEVN